MQRVMLDDAISQLRMAIDGLSANHSLCLVSFAYGFLLARGVADEDACNISEKFESYGRRPTAGETVSPK